MGKVGHAGGLGLGAERLASWAEKCRNAQDSPEEAKAVVDGCPRQWHCRFASMKMTPPFSCLENSRRIAYVPPQITTFCTLPFWYTEADSVANCALKDIHRLVLAKWSHTLAIPSVGCCQIIFPLLSLWMKEREKYQKDQKISGEKGWTSYIFYVIPLISRRQC